MTHEPMTGTPPAGPAPSADSVDQRPDVVATPSPVRRHPLAAAIAAALAVTVAVVVVLTGQPAPTPTPTPTTAPTPTPTPTPGGRGPQGETVLFSDKFSDGNWCGYNRVQNKHFSGPACDYHNKSYSLRVVDGAARFEVRPGDSPGGGLGGGERSEISQDSASWQASDGDEWYVQERLKLGKDFQPGRWTLITQFHAGVGSPPLSLQVSPKGALVLGDGGKAGDANIAAGKRDRELIPAATFRKMRGDWFDVDMHIRWSNRASVGGTEVYIDGKLVAPWRKQQTMASSRIYWKAGIYRAPTDSTQVVWLDDVVISSPAGGRG